MARPGGKEVGRVNIRVVPDGSRFRKDLKVTLERAERTERVSIVVNADVSPADASLNRLYKHWNGQKVTLDAAAATAGAAAALAYTSRPREVPLIVTVNRASVVKAANIIAALSGARVAADLVQNLAEKLGNLDRSLPRIAMVATGVTSLVSAVLSATGGLFTLTTGLAQLSGLAALLPGLMFASAAAVTTLALALSDTKKQLADLAPGFRNLRRIVVDNFWARARGPIRDFVNSTLPELNRGLGRSATALGTWTAALSRGFQNAFGNGALRSILDDVSRSITIASTGTAGFASAITRLGVVGASYLPRLTQWTADLSNKFARFVSMAESDGSLQRFIENGIVASKQLGTALLSIGQIIAGISNAAQSAGGGGLAALATSLVAAAAAVNSPAFQTALSTLFSGAAAGAAGLATALAPLGKTLATLAPLLSNILAGTGRVLGEVLGQIATAIAAPAFQTGLAVFFEGILDGIQAIAPALPEIADGLGSLLQFAGQLAGQLGPVLGAALSAIAPILSTFLDALSNEDLGLALTEAIVTLTPSLIDLAEAIAPLLPSIVRLVEELLPGWTMELLLVTQALAAVLPVLTPIIDAITWLASLTSGFSRFTTEVLTAGVSLSLTAQALSGEFGPAVQVALGLMVGLFERINAVTALTQTAVAAVAGVWNAAWSAMAVGFNAIWAGIQATARRGFSVVLSLGVSALNGLIAVINAFLRSLQAVAGGISALTGGAINFSVSTIPSVSVPALASGADVLATPGGVLTRLGEGGRDERVVDRGLGNAALAATIALAQRALASSSPTDTETPVYADTGELIAVIRRLANGEARLVFASELGDLGTDLGAGG